MVSIPTNRPVARVDHHDEIYRNKDEKYAAILAQIKDCMERKQPVLVGTVSIEKSEELAALVRKELGINPAVLNAKHHESEAKIVAQAGAPGAVTIATNMAGRGTDIKLGGNAEELIAALDKDDKKYEAKIVNTVTNVDNKYYVVLNTNSTKDQIEETISGFMSSSFIPFVSITTTCFKTPTCGEAMPTPSSFFIVSYISSKKVAKFSSNLATFFDFSNKILFGYVKTSKTII